MPAPPPPPPPGPPPPPTFHLVSQRGVCLLVSLSVCLSFLSFFPVTSILLTLLSRAILWTNHVMTSSLLPPSTFLLLFGVCEPKFLPVTACYCSFSFTYALLSASPLFYGLKWYYTLKVKQKNPIFGYSFVHASDFKMSHQTCGLQEEQQDRDVYKCFGIYLAHNERLLNIKECDSYIFHCVLKFSKIRFTLSQ